jgi:rhamnosyltransferase
VLREVGPMREDFFIDHVDIEWSHRMRAAGHALFGVGAAASQASGTALAIACFSPCRASSGC